MAQDLKNIFKNRKYDLICSLGGNCMAASQLKQRDMRPYSLPFDWCYYTTLKPFEYLNEGFKNKFKNFLLKENLVELKGEEYNQTHTDKAQYKDIYTGYYFANHFPLNVPFDKSYELVYKKTKKRLKRLIKKIEQSKNILFLLSTTVDLETETLEKLKNTLNEIYPNKNFAFKAIIFNHKGDETIEKDNIYIKKCSRNPNIYDYIRTNIEWQEMVDNISLNTPKILCRKTYTKKGIGIQLLPFINTLFYIKLYLFGIRFEITIGKIRK